MTRSGAGASTGPAGGGAHGSIVTDFERRLTRFARASADFIAIRVKWALRKCVARRIRSSSVRMQSGSAWRSNVDMKASLAALVMSWGSLRECATCAPRRPLSACEIFGDCAVRSDGSNAVASLATPQYALDRNIEAGLCVRDRSLAQALAAHFQRLIDTSLVVPLPAVG